jgi:hypothetical protein
VTLRPGSYNASRPRFRGVIRGDGYPWYACAHTTHERQREATACSKAAREAIRGTLWESGGPDPGSPLPEGWEVFEYGRHAGL